MKTIQRLERTDIEFILADYFGVSKNAVTVIPFMDTVGYGISEHEEPEVKAEVIIDEGFLENK